MDTQDIIVETWRRKALVYPRAGKMDVPHGRSGAERFEAWPPCARRA